MVWEPVRVVEHPSTARTDLDGTSTVALGTFSKEVARQGLTDLMPNQVVWRAHVVLGELDDEGTLDVKVVADTIEGSDGMKITHARLIDAWTRNPIDGRAVLPREFQIAYDIEQHGQVVLSIMSPVGVALQVGDRPGTVDVTIGSTYNMHGIGEDLFRATVGTRFMVAEPDPPNGRVNVPNYPQLKQHLHKLVAKLPDPTDQWNTNDWIRAWQGVMDGPDQTLRARTSMQLAAERGATEGYYGWIDEKVLLQASIAEPHRWVSFAIRHNQPAVAVYLSLVGVVDALTDKSTNVDLAAPWLPPFEKCTQQQALETRLLALEAGGPIGTHVDQRQLREMVMTARQHLDQAADSYRQPKGAALQPESVEALGQVLTTWCDDLTNAFTMDSYSARQVDRSIVERTKPLLDLLAERFELDFVARTEPEVQQLDIG